MFAFNILKPDQTRITTSESWQAGSLPTFTSISPRSSVRNPPSFCNISFVVLLMWILSATETYSTPFLLHRYQNMVTIHSMKRSLCYHLCFLEKFGQESFAGPQPKTRKLQQVCWHPATDIRMRSHGLRQLVDDKSVASCQQTCCKLIVKTCYPQACCKLFQQVVTSLQMKGCNKPDFNRLVAAWWNWQVCCNFWHVARRR